MGITAKSNLASEAVGDEAVVSLVRERLYTAVVGDILDAMGRYHQFLPPMIHGIREDSRVIGRAMPVVIADVFGPQRQPFGELTAALDQLERGEVYVACNGSAPAAAWGEILTVAARARGAVGAVIDGHHRDTPAVLAQDWPVFSRGGYAQDAAVRKTVVAYRTSVELGGVRVDPGDLVFGDRDGVVVIPRSIESEVIERALEKASAENIVRAAIEAGMSATEAFQTYGVL